MKIFDEQKHALNMLEHGFEKGMTGNELLILAKYYRSFDMKDKEIEQKLMDFCEKFVPDYNETLFYDKISKITRSSKGKHIRQAEDIPITENEIKTIRSIKNYRYEKVLFVMLALGKYYRITNKQSTSKNFFVADQPRTIFDFAHTAQKKGENIFRELNALGLIDYINRTDCYFIKFSSLDDTSEIVTNITDMNNIISFYPAVCEDCGRVIKVKSDQITKCNDCYKRYRNKERYY